MAFAMATPLRRLLPYHDRYKLPFWGGMGGLLAARLFEAAIPLFLRDGIDAMLGGGRALASGSVDLDTARARRTPIAWRARRSLTACTAHA